MELSAKQQQFNAAMELYTSRRCYKILGIAVSTINVTLQIYLFCLVWPHSIGMWRQLVSLFVAYLVADFINGVVHMVMDNTDHYDSPFGPLVANFHLHHKTPRYKKHNLLVVYVVESGSKVWLSGYLLAVLFFVKETGGQPLVSYILVYTGILSSVAEVSHYLCHSSVSVVAGWLGNIGLLLSKRHHAEHHMRDNCNYAFLNGSTDPLINLIASACCKGYKQNTDLHYEHYTGAASEDR